MERLTTYRKDGRAAISNNDGATPLEQTMKIPKAIDRLAAYEDTGLEPEEIEKAMDIVKSAVSAFEDFGVDRLAELAQADREGRCVVLPEGGCEDKDGENALKSAMNTCFYHNNPVTRFIADAVAEKLTRQEAEAALRREQDGNRI